MTEKPDSKIDFPAILASSVHDIKNSLGAIRALIAELATQHQELAGKNDFIQLEYEANRMNNSLMQLLILYKIDRKRFQISIDEHSTLDILNEIVAQQADLLALNNIQLETACPEDLYCFCDAALICNAIGTILNNAQRYAHKRILLSAYRQDEYVAFSIEDDGEGYPEAFLNMPPRAKNMQIDYHTGSTGLGLYFVAIIAEMHGNGHKKGLILNDNHSSLNVGGARFILFLP